MYACDRLRFCMKTAPECTLAEYILSQTTLWLSKSDFSANVGSRRRDLFDKIGAFLRKGTESKLAVEKKIDTALQQLDGGKLNMKEEVGKILDPFVLRMREESKVHEGQLLDHAEALEERFADLVMAKSDHLEGEMNRYEDLAYDSDRSEDVTSYVFLTLILTLQFG